MNNVTQLNASPILNVGAKNDANVSATSERLANSINFSAYNFRWYSLISIGKSISYGLCCVNKNRHSGYF